MAGADPVAWIKANPGRIKIVHLKDWAPGSRADEKGYRVPLRRRRVALEANNRSP